MYASIDTKLSQLKANGRLALLANLLFDIVLVGWYAFAGLYALEILLPTFVIARLSLVKLAIALLVLTTFLAWLSTVLELQPVSPKSKRSYQLFLTSVIIASVGVITLAHYRFPWWAILITLTGYALALWLFVRENRTER
jgi:hypothetical protein